MGVAGTGNWYGLEELRPMLARYLGARCRDASETEDLLQETLLRAARYRRSLIEPKRLRAWALRIASNVHRDRARDAARVPSVKIETGPTRAPESREFWLEPEVEEVLEIEGERIERPEALALLARAAERLCEEDRRMLAAHYGGRQSCVATARELGLDPTLVKVRLFRARRRLERSIRHEVVEQRAQRLVGGAR